MRQFVVVAFVLMLAGTAFAQSAAQSSNRALSASTSSAQPSSAEQRQVEQNLKDVHFEFDKYDFTDQDRQILQQNAEWLKANPNVTVSIAGNADERGDIVYNLALSHKRAEATRDALIALGVDENRIDFATGWGKLYPVCNQPDESCFSQNRRAHFTPGTMLQTETVAEGASDTSTVAHK